MSKTIFIFDLDGTITSQETLPIISNHFNVGEEISELTKSTVDGNIPFVESFIKRVNILGRLPVSEINELLSNVPLSKEVLQFIQNHVGDCVIASGNFKGWIEKLCQRIGCQYFCSDGIVFDDKISKLTHILKKEEVVAHFQNLGNEVVFIGDGNNDAMAMRKANVSIACGIVHEPANSVLTFADYSVYSESALVRLLNQIHSPKDGKSVVITCAGIGSRLGLERTKALIEIEGKPLIYYQLSELTSVDDVRVVVGFQASEVIEAVLKERKDVVFVYNHDYFHTKTGASYYLGAKHGNRYAIAWDGDLLVHPLDVRKCLEYNGQFVGCSDIVSDEPVFANVDDSGNVVSFSRERGDFEWVGPACLEKDKIKFVSNNVFNQFEGFLPLPMVKTNARDVDTYEDYLRAIEFIRSWGDE